MQAPIECRVQCRDDQNCNCLPDTHDADHPQGRDEDVQNHVELSVRRRTQGQQRRQPCLQVLELVARQPAS
eukprot:scaffold8079_cov444-Prasinococcus_capsulatus_cf.AAC.3